VFFVCTLALAYFGNAQPRTGTSSVLEGAAVSAPAPAVDASGAAQIPGSTAPVAVSEVPVAPPAPAASGAGQIPTK